MAGLVSCGDLLVLDMLNIFNSIRLAPNLMIQLILGIGFFLSCVEMDCVLNRSGVLPLEFF